MIYLHSLHYPPFPSHSLCSWDQFSWSLILQTVRALPAVLISQASLRTKISNYGGLAATRSSPIGVLIKLYIFHSRSLFLTSTCVSAIYNTSIACMRDLFTASLFWINVNNDGKMFKRKTICLIVLRIFFERFFLWIIVPNAALSIPIADSSGQDQIIETYIGTNIFSNPNYFHRPICVWKNPVFFLRVFNIKIDKFMRQRWYSLSNLSLFKVFVQTINPISYDGFQLASNIAISLGFFHCPHILFINPYTLFRHSCPSWWVSFRPKRPY